jgi:hypothetical protein
LPLVFSNDSIDVDMNLLLSRKKKMFKLFLSIQN